jgi:DNA helicase-2/ATP-dependent DNA helicase PcrA
MIEIQKLFKNPEYYLDLVRLSPDELREKYLRATATDEIIFYGYLWQEKKCFGLDYNDLIKFTLYIFQEHADIRESGADAAGVHHDRRVPGHRPAARIS